MKKILLLFLTIVSTQLFSQDVIYKMDRTEIKCKVDEITTEEIVKYRESDNLDGPLLNIKGDQIFMIRYGSGKTWKPTNNNTVEKKEEAVVKKPEVTTAAIADSFAQLKKEITVAKTYSKYDSLMKASKSNKAWGVVGCIVGPVFIISGAVTMALAPAHNNSTTDPNADLENTQRSLDLALGSVQIACGVLELIVGPICIVKSKKQYEAAQQYKGQVYMSMPTLRMNNFGSRTGIAIGTTVTF